MSAKLEFNKTIDSCNAIREYIHAGEIDDKRDESHDANVVVENNNGIILSENLKVRSIIETNESFVDISWRQEHEARFYTRYSNLHHMFIYEKGTLFIDCEERNGNRIRICID